MADSPQRSNGGLPVAAVVFDLFNTLTAPVDRSAYRASVVEMARAVGADPDAFAQGWSDEWRKRFNGAHSTIQAGVLSVCNTIGARVDETSISEASQIRFEYSRRTLRPRPDALATLARLRAQGLQTALISDCSPDIPVLRPTTPFAQAIDEPLFSCVEGLTKPEPSIYLRACERLGVEPRVCVYVGDGGSRELTGAQRVGMHAILITTPVESAAYSSERASWRGEAIDALSELPGLITGAGTIATD